MTDRVQFDIELRGQTVSVDVHVLPPDRDVGIMSFGFEDEVITDNTGAILLWELTDDEVEKICEQVDSLACDDGQPDYVEEVFDSPLVQPQAD